MAIFSYSASVIQRSKGQSAVASAAYQNGISMIDNRTGEKHNYSRADHAVVNIGAVYAGCKKPESPEDFWNKAEAAEKRKNSRTARKLIIALPAELSKKQHWEIVKEHMSFLVKEYQAGASASLHYDKEKNPHVHIQMTTRRVNKNGEFTEKIRELDGSYKQRKIEIEKMREAWSTTCNLRLQKSGYETVDHRSYKRQGIDKVATKHLGPAATALQKKGIETDKSNYNKNAETINTLQQDIKTHDANIQTLEAEKSSNDVKLKKWQSAIKTREAQRSRERDLERERERSRMRDIERMKM